MVSPEFYESPAGGPRPGAALWGDCTRLLCSLPCVRVHVTVSVSFVSKCLFTPLPVINDGKRGFLNCIRHFLNSCPDTSGAGAHESFMCLQSRKQFKIHCCPTELATYLSQKKNKEDRNNKRKKPTQTATSIPVPRHGDNRVGDFSFINEHTSV